MDIVFNCANCQQELAIDAAEAGSELQCPTCGTALTVPAPTEANTQPGASAPPPSATPPPTPQPAPPPPPAPPPEKVFSVPQRSTPAEALIEKPKPSLEVAAKQGDRVRVKTIKHGDCVDISKDKFDEIVAEVIAKIGYDNIISMTPFSYSHIAHGGSTLLTDYALMIIYKG